MHKYHLVRLRPGSPFHLARGKSDYVAGFDYLHSDTLKSALLATAVQLYGDEILKEQTALSCPWLEGFGISSAFAYLENELFFPKPLLSQIEIEGDASGKLSKNIRFVGREYFETLLKGEGIQAPSKHLSEDGEYLSHLFGSKDEVDRYISQKNVEQRVTVPRWGGGEDADAKPYYLERIFFREEAGLFFLLDCADEIQRAQILHCLSALGENGIGMDRSSGNGHFEVLDVESVEYPALADAPYVVNLSLFCPEQDTLEQKQFLEKSAYALIKRGGWITQAEGDALSSYRKKSVYMFREGSIFPNGRLEGKIVNLRPSVAGKGHPIWRDGQALFLPLSLQSNSTT